MTVTSESRMLSPLRVWLSQWSICTAHSMGWCPVGTQLLLGGWVAHEVLVGTTVICFFVIVWH